MRGCLRPWRRARLLRTGPACRASKRFRINRPLCCSKPLTDWLCLSARHPCRPQRDRQLCQVVKGAIVVIDALEADDSPVGPAAARAARCGA